MNNYFYFYFLFDEQLKFLQKRSFITPCIGLISSLSVENSVLNLRVRVRANSDC